MKGSLHPKNDETINPSGNESIRDVLDRVQLNRRRFLQTSVSASVLAALGGVTVEGFVRAVEAAPIPPASGFGGIGFESILPSLAPVADQVAVPPGYRVEPLLCWGDPILPGAPAWLEDATQSASDQEKQFGMHCDGSHFFPFPSRGVGAGESPTRGLMCVNHEYTHEEILHPDGLEHVPANASKGVPELGKQGSVLTVQKVRKSQAAHGVSVVEIAKRGGKWQAVPNSPFGRRITANTPMKISGPAAGHALLKVKQFDITPNGSVDTGKLTDGTVAWGTANNCAHGYTPWGTYIACEENWNGYFGWKDGGKTAPTPLESRYGIARNGFVYNNASSSAAADAIYSIYKWYQKDDRWDTAVDPNTANTFGWRVEIDPFDPKSTPVKRTALGRFKCESAQFVVGNDNHVGVYMGDDERNEYIYKFVCAGRFDPKNRAANRNLLDQGTLYVAKFTDTAVAGKPDTYRGQWIPLRPDTLTVIDDGAGGKKRLRDLPEFAGASDAEVQALICIKTRMAGDAVGATIMDRPEWTALRTYDAPGKSDARYGYGPDRPLEVYCTLTNNNRRGGGGSSIGTSINNPNGSTAAASARPPVDVANPRPDNDYGHIIRWREDGHTPTAVGFEWDLFVLCGDSAHGKSLGGTYLKDNFIGVGASDPDFNKRIYEGNITDVPAGSADFGAPDGMWFDHFGRLWIQTDQAGDGSGDWKNIGSNVMVCALTSPPNCEVTGVVTTPDGRAMFVGIQHPGEDSTANDPTQYSNWPQGQFGTNSAGIALPNGPGRRPRSTVLVITREDGGVVGA
ncbi:MAG: PhoX family phosphatase [Gammaproteobacteria bacterium]|nr:PhoX family phosphatase [Gammaproteobacteria bacterium]